MTKNLFLTAAVLVLAFGAFAAQAAKLKNIGFLQSTIWYSKDPIFTGDRVRVYTAVFNDTERDLLGTVEFYDSRNLIGKADFAVGKLGRIKDVWAFWTVSGGEHRVSAKITNARFALPSGGYEEVVLENIQTPENKFTAEPDTDKDGIGNSADEDDDGDLILDAMEIKQGTNPLKSDAGVAASTSSPAAILKKALPVLRTTLNSIDAFAQKGEAFLETEKEKNKKLVVDAATTPFRFMYLAMISAASFVLANKIALYAALAAAAYYTLKFIWRRIFH